MLCCVGLRHAICSVVVVTGSAAAGSSSALYLTHLGPTRDERE
jgi:hypothetical protein